MYSISNDYRTKMLDQVQTHRLTGLLAGTISFTDADVIGVSYHNQCSGKNVALGSVNIGTLKLTFLNDPLNRGDYYGKTISISDGLLVDNSDPDNPVFEDIPIGVFYIAEATWRASGMVDIQMLTFSKGTKSQHNQQRQERLLLQTAQSLAFYKKLQK